MIDKTSILWAEIDMLAAEVFELKAQIAEMKAEISELKNNKKSSGNIVVKFNTKS